jgi:glutamate decarboxylase
MAPKLEHTKLLRVVVREDFSRSRCELLLRDILAALKALDAIDKKSVEAHRQAKKKRGGWAFTNPLLFVYRAVKLDHAHRSAHKNIAHHKSKESDPVRDANGVVHSLESKTAPGIC